MKIIVILSAILLGITNLLEQEKWQHINNDMMTSAEEIAYDNDISKKCKSFRQIAIKSLKESFDIAANCLPLPTCRESSLPATPSGQQLTAIRL